ncbi:hypothetical protein [Salmonirosea aquatica]|uniref:Uncharacterized protein n=1 Tax=Salmonirosea aquatica TaxID=2654236 RepID=A0A7C9F8J2_9BACT|nr:hypothetical protein [Cytophagaceae bacterium SJW1-29]
MQLSLVELFPELNKGLFLDIFAKMTLDPRTRKPTLTTLNGQRVPGDFKIRCQHKYIGQFPEGTIYKLDVRLVNYKKGKPYFSAVQNRRIQRALEFFDHNMRIQRGFSPAVSVSTRMLQRRVELG